MRKFLMLACVCLLAGAASATTIFYSVEDSWTGVPGLSTSNASVVLSNTTDGNTLTVIFAPEEPGGGVGSPTNTAWGSLYLVESAAPSTGTDVYDFSTLTLTLELIDTTTSEGVTYTGTLSGNYTSTPGNASNTSSGSISWSPTGLQALPLPSTVSFVTDASDSIGVKLSALISPLTNPATTVNGTVESTPASTTPEPATMAMMGAGLLAVGLFNRRRRKN